MFFGPFSYKSSLAQHQRVLSYIRSLLPVLSAGRTSAAFLRPACLFSRALHTIADDHCQSPAMVRSEEHTSELQSRLHLVCRLLLEKKKRQRSTPSTSIR